MHSNFILTSAVLIIISYLIVIAKGNTYEPRSLNILRHNDDIYQKQQQQQQYEYQRANKKTILARLKEQIQIAKAERNFKKELKSILSKEEKDLKKTLSNRSPLLDVVAVVGRRNVDGNIEILMIPDTNNERKWILPSGMVKYGENPEHAVIRSLEETVHVTSTVRPILVSADDDESKLHKVSLVYAVLADSIDYGTDGIENARGQWVSLVKACEPSELLINRFHRSIVRKYRYWVGNGVPAGLNLLENTYQPISERDSVSVAVHAVDSPDGMVEIDLNSPPVIADYD